jgi:hypothetical protein
MISAPAPPPAPRDNPHAPPLGGGPATLLRRTVAARSARLCAGVRRKREFRAAWRAQGAATPGAPSTRARAPGPAGGAATAGAHTAAAPDRPRHGASAHAHITAAPGGPRHAATTRAHTTAAPDRPRHDAGGRRP